LQQVTISLITCGVSRSLVLIYSTKAEDIRIIIYIKNKVSGMLTSGRNTEGKTSFKYAVRYPDTSRELEALDATAIAFCLCEM
jgi:hypothetical protein